MLAYDVWKLGFRKVTESDFDTKPRSLDRIDQTIFGRSGGSLDHLPREEALKREPDRDADIETFIRNGRNAEDRQAFRNARRLIEHRETTFDELVSGGAPGIMTAIRDYREAISPAALPAAFVEDNRLASAILRATTRLASALPHLGIHAVAIADKNWLHPLPREQIMTFAAQVEGWTPPYCDEALSTGTGDPLSRKTAKEYRNYTMLIPTLLAKTGCGLDPDTDVAACTEPESVALWLPLFRQHYAEKTRKAKLASIKRVVVDVLGNNHPNVGPLLAEIKTARRSDDAMSADDVENARNLSRAENGTTVTIWAAPELIEERANAKFLATSDQNSRRSSALASQLVIRKLFTPQMLVQVHLVDSIQQVNGETCLVVTKDGESVPFPLSTEELRQIARLIEFRVANGILPMWLFANRKGDAPQDVMAAMATLSRNFHAVLGVRLTPTMVRDAVLVDGVDNYPERLEDLADAALMKGTQWLTKKFRIPVERPLLDDGGGVER